MKPIKILYLSDKTIVTTSYEEIKRHCERQDVDIFTINRALLEMVKDKEIQLLSIKEA